MLTILIRLFTVAFSLFLCATVFALGEKSSSIGDAPDKDGPLSYSLTQTSFHTATSENHSIGFGVQQSFQIIVMDMGNVGMVQTKLFRHAMMSPSTE